MAAKIFVLKNWTVFFLGPPCKPDRAAAIIEIYKSLFVWWKIEQNLAENVTVSSLLIEQQRFCGAERNKAQTKLMKMSA